MPARINLVTLGVKDLAASKRFYDALGWARSPASTDEVAFYHTGGVPLALYRVEMLASDLGSPTADPAPFRSTTLSLNVETPEHVDEVVAEMVAAGGTLLQAPHPTAWGGYAGYAADPDGWPWEIAHNPGFPLDVHGMIVLPADPAGT